MLRLPLVFLLFSCLTSVAESQSNGRCNASLPMESFPFDVSGNTSSLPPLVFTDNENLCEPFGSPGLWYSLVGDGNCYKLTSKVTVPDDAPYRRASISVLTNPCDNLRCVQSESSFNLEGVTETLKTEDGRLYHVVVSAEVDSPAAFTGDVEPVSCTALCEVGTELTNLPTTVTGNTELGFPQSDYGLRGCRIGDDSRLEFFKYNGTDSCVSIEVESLAFDPVVLIYTGSCDFLSCFHRSHNIRFGPQDTVEFGKSAKWFAVEGTEYTIAVTGANTTQVGEYSLKMTQVECPQAPMNTACDAAQTLDLAPSGLNGSFVLAPSVVPDQINNCSSLYNLDDNVGLWYEFLGDGFCFRVSQDTYDSRKVSVYEGACDELMCVADDFSASTDFRAEAGVTYKILALGQSYKGDFNIKLERSGSCTGDVPSNNECVDASLVDSLPFLINGETMGATQDDNATIGASCEDVNPRGHIVWYEVVGDGSCLNVSTRGSSLDTVLGLYTSEDIESCVELECLTSNDDIGLSTRSSELLWQSEPGTRYKLALGGSFVFDRGFYTLSITSTETCPERSFCELCADGSIPDENLSFDVLSCREISASIAKELVDSVECILFRQIGVAYCGCPIPENTPVCNVCGEEGLLPQNPAANVTDTQAEPICNDFISAPALDSETCDAVAFYGDICECAEPTSCSLCPDGALPHSPDVHVPYFFDEYLTCSEWSTQLKSQAFPECSEPLPGFSITSFCCPRQKPADICVVCNDGEDIVDVDAIIPGLAQDFTCGQLLEAAPHYTTEEGCARLSDAASFCCGTDNTASPTTPSTSSPIATTDTPTIAPTTSRQADPTSSPVSETEGPTESPVASPTEQPVSATGGVCFSCLLVVFFSTTVMMLNL